MAPHQPLRRGSRLATRAGAPDAARTEQVRLALAAAVHRRKPHVGHGRRVVAAWPLLAMWPVLFAFYQGELALGMNV